ncbi:hypothetical protein KY940_004391 [Vibrio vulnificus]|nr:hypothetical protein [Vibrio vulnificus]
MTQDEKDTSIFFLKSWLQEAIYSGTQFLVKINQPFDINDTWHRRCMFDEHYVLTATVMSVRFSRQLVNHAPKNLKVSLEHFIEQTRDAVDVRDMREHFDEYFLGKGRKKDQFLKGSTEQIQCDMSSSIQNEHGYMLGNLIAIESIIGSCEMLLGNLEKYA